MVPSQEPQYFRAGGVRHVQGGGSTAGGLDGDSNSGSAVPEFSDTGRRDSSWAARTLSGEGRARDLASGVRERGEGGAILVSAI